MIRIDALENWITWRWDDEYLSLDETTIDHVWSMMKEGYTSGELCRLDKNDKEIRGWWTRRNDVQ